MSDETLEILVYICGFGFLVVVGVLLTAALS
jgi:hypothetical protein